MVDLEAKNFLLAGLLITNFRVALNCEMVNIYEMMCRALSDVGGTTRSIFLSLAVACLFLGFAVNVNAGDKTQFANTSVSESRTPEGSGDPLEPINRFVFEFNDLVYSIVLRPVAEIFRTMVPKIARDGVRNALQNLNAPFVLVNDVFQGEMGRAWNTSRRIVINSTIGVVGLYDAASDIWGIDRHTEDIGQTLGVWGVGEGFYLVLPVLGPSNPRDAIGQVSKSFLDPVSQYLDHIDEKDAILGRVLTVGIDQYARTIDDLDRLKETSIDYYAAVRSIYRQKRKIEIMNRAPVNSPIPDLHYDLNVELASN